MIVVVVLDSLPIPMLSSGDGGHAFGVVFETTSSGQANGCERMPELPCSRHAFKMLVTEPLEVPARLEITFLPRPAICCCTTRSLTSADIGCVMMMLYIIS